MRSIVANDTPDTVPAVNRLLCAVRWDCFLALPHRGINLYRRVGRNDRGVLGLPRRNYSVLRGPGFSLPSVTTAPSQTYHGQRTCDCKPHITLRVDAPALSARRE